jgi:hypothetical protein
MCLAIQFKQSIPNDDPYVTNYNKWALNSNMGLNTLKKKKLLRKCTLFYKWRDDAPPSKTTSSTARQHMSFCIQLTLSLRLSIYHDSWEIQFQTLLRVNRRYEN